MHFKLSHGRANHTSSRNRTWVHIRHSHGQDQLDCADTADVEWLAAGVWGRVSCQHGPALCRRLPVSAGRRHLGREHSRWLGICHCQFRLVDWNRTRGNSDLRHSASAAAVMAQLDQPLCGGDDIICRGLRRDVSHSSSWPAVARVLVVSLSQHDAGLATVPQPAGVGRVCGVDLRHHLTAVLVCRPDPRSGNAA